MRVPEKFSCDVCGAEKGAVNRWFLITFGERAVIVEPWEGATVEAIAGADRHLCGEAHVQVEISKFLSRPRITLQGDTGAVDQALQFPQRRKS